MSQWPSHANPRPERSAKAPYNFVPLPEAVLPAQDPPNQDRYDTRRHTGWLACTLTTASPLYVRAPFTRDEFEQALREQTEEEARKAEPEQGNKDKDKKPTLWYAKKRHKADFFYTNDPETPTIPGSSLRGMLRSLVEIVGYGKVGWVTDQPRYFFRAVAAPRSDPLQRPYRDAMGRVQAGYVVPRDGRWYILPAQPAERESYLKAKEDFIPDDVLPSDKRFNSPKYKPHYQAISFTTKRTPRGRLVVDQIGKPDQYRMRGVLVCTGNMLETEDKDDRQRERTGKREQQPKSPRKNHAVIREPIMDLDRTRTSDLIPIDEQAVQGYLGGLTEFQKTAPPYHPQRGVLKEGCPIFYLVDDDGRVRRFGHTPNFRVPYVRRDAQEERASTPLDFVPKELREESQTDLADALFGYARNTGKGKARACAGRVFVTDARLVEGQSDVWLNGGEPLTPRILASPKPTTFQHYLVQPSPNDPASLRHYASATPKETVIRGHKLYWHKGERRVSDLRVEKEPENPHDTQHTRMRPVKADTQFTFKIYFENLSNEELGVLLWILARASEDAYRLKLGMGKPFGMGAVRIQSTLHLTDRAQRYRHLFSSGGWDEGMKDAANVAQEAIKAYEERILGNPRLNPTGAQSLAEVWRIRALLALLAWPGPRPPEEKTRYLEIEHPTNGNEYKGRPVLPDPLAVHPQASVASSARLTAGTGERMAASQVAPPNYQYGELKMWSRGASGFYGFIRPDKGGRDVYVHEKRLAPGVSSLKAKQRVIYRETPGMKGPEAEDVRPAPASEREP